LSLARLPWGQQEGAVAFIPGVPADDAAPVVDPVGFHEFQPRGAGLFERVQVRWRDRSFRPEAGVEGAISFEVGSTDDQARVVDVVG
jgi:hypothetical protein